MTIPGTLICSEVNGGLTSKIVFFYSPLDVCFQIAVENMRLKREEEEQARELKELETRLQKARTKRQLNEKLKVRASVTHSSPLTWFHRNGCCF